MEAMREIWSALGLDGVLALLSDGDGWTVGRYAAPCATDLLGATEVLRVCLATEVKSPEELDAFMGGFISCIDEDTRSTVLSTLSETVEVDQVVRLFECAPFRDQTWRLLDRQDGSVRERYWQAVVPAIARFTESEVTELIDRLLEAHRPRAAFSVVQFDWSKVETSRLKRLLEAVISGNSEPAGHFEIESWHLSAALDSLDGRPGVTADEMAQLEFSCSDALLSLRRTKHRGHGIPNLERKISESPGMFVQAVALVSKRKDDGHDPPEWHVDDPGRRASLQSATFRLLQEITRVPGTADDGRVDAHALSQWVTEVRRLCSENGRATVGDQQIGQFLSKAPSEKDGLWPCRSVCGVLETIASQDLAAGFGRGVYNARGAHMRSLDEGGKQERELAAKYRAWAERLTFDYPYVASILERIAKHYDRDAEREDVEVLTMNGLEH
jgi:hypothetical protein